MVSSNSMIQHMIIRNKPFVLVCLLPVLVSLLLGNFPYLKIFFSSFLQNGGTTFGNNYINLKNLLAAAIFDNFYQNQ